VQALLPLSADAVVLPALPGADHALGASQLREQPDAASRAPHRSPRPRSERIPPAVSLIEFVLGFILGGCIVLWALEFRRDLHAKMRDEDL
jgi:hypothetical protein